MILFILGYFLMGSIFLVCRLCYHVFSEKKYSLDDLIPATKNDFVSLFTYARQIIFSNPTKFKIIVVIIACAIIVKMLPLEIDTKDICEEVMSAIVYLFMVVVFAPQKNSSQKKFPVEIFGFIYSIVFMYYSAGEVVIDVFKTDNSFHEDMWIYGYGVVLISYVICIAALSDFMDRDLSRVEIIFVGMIMMTILEFMTYYGIGFFGGINFFDPNELFEGNILEDIATILNQGIYIASQSQILGRSSQEVLGYIILNGTDVLTMTAVFGYLVQKLIGPSAI